jgi:hypothetical protein
VRPLLERLLERDPLLRELLRDPLLRDPPLLEPPLLEPPPPRPPRWLISSSSVAEVGAASKADRAAAGCSISKTPIAPARPVFWTLFVIFEWPP